MCLNARNYLGFESRSLSLHDTGFLIGTVKSYYFFLQFVDTSVLQLAIPTVDVLLRFEGIYLF